MDILFSYRIEAEAELAEDSNCYSQAKFGGCYKNFSQEKLNKHHEKLRIAVANAFGIDVKYVTPISNEEYDKEMSTGEYNTREVINVTK